MLSSPFISSLVKVTEWSPHGKELFIRLTCMFSLNYNYLFVILIISHFCLAYPLSFNVFRMPFLALNASSIRVTVEICYLKQICLAHLFFNASTFLMRCHFFFFFRFEGWSLVLIVPVLVISRLFLLTNGICCHNFFPVPRNNY